MFLNLFTNCGITEVCSNLYLFRIFYISTEAVQAQQPSTTEVDVKSRIQQFFKYAPDRRGGVGRRSLTQQQSIDTGSASAAAN